ncbi:c-type cytochrome biogenesis protein CcmI [Marinimicrobium sp. C6131]|uniref:c-type cytochrome biogenesis protein CcmI n=1 Tax=Marinimicrobium sp. C6131 TaxID=3022676 RepID=UPI00223D768B|nr:c-type cytochrome biogenesis protein CcmI [Marinimicrobium sp. C6131]UZJ45401.1 c-type cytochrome biogenesis protein CcmI [Marinimicrobium sp. C6131]
MMTPLWWVMALMVVVALAFFLWPMRRKATGSHLEQVRRHYLETNVALFRKYLAELKADRDAGRINEETFEQLKLEQERALLEEERELASSKPVRGRALPGGRVLIIVAAVSMIGSLAFYQWRGASEDVFLANLQANKARLDREERMSDQRVDPSRTWELVEHIQARLKREPESTQYLFLLAHYSRELGHYDQAVDAYERILALEPGSARIRAELAETLFIRDDNRIGERARSLIDEALAADPQETTALGLAGIDAFGKRDFQEAIDYWQRALDVMNPQSGNAMAFQRGIERAREALGQTGESSAPEISEGQVSITVEVTLDEQVQYDGDETVFVYARAWDGSPMPLAIRRISASQLPISITLDETMAMSPSASLATVEQVELVARLSPSGDAVPQAGDWEGRMGPVDVGNASDSLTLVIDEPIAE